MPSNEEKYKAARKGCGYMLLSLVIAFTIAAGISRAHFPDLNMFGGLILWYVCFVVTKRVVFWVYSEEIAKIDKVVYADKEEKKNDN
jgi:hypothetical protein